MLPASTITIGIDPTVDLGPITLAWHGITIALGILVAALLARIAYSRERGVDPDTLVNSTSQWASLALVALAAVGALASTRWSRTRSDPLASDG